MTKKYKRGDVLEVEHKIPNTRKKIRAFGIVVSVSDKELVLGHNFLKTEPIDATKILLKSILKSRKITPQEINSFKDLE